MQNNDYNSIEEYMEYFKKQPLKDKQSIVIDNLLMLNDYTNKLCNELFIEKKQIKNKELDDVKKEEYTQNDFAEAVMVLVDSIQNSIIDYSVGISDSLDYLDKVASSNEDK